MNGKNRRGSLFDRVRIGPLELPNRIVMAPMTRNRAGRNGEPTELNARYYSQRSSAGLIVSEASQISPQGVGYPRTPGIHSDEQVEGWRLVTEAVHRAGGRIFLQLWHVGRISHPSLQPGGCLPVAPSAVRPEGETVTWEGPQPFETPRPLELDEIPAIVGQYGDATRRARSAGFDGVEIHAANGYLIDQFLRDGTNLRNDAYGGSVENRARFLFETVEAACDAWAPGHVGVRLSPTSAFNSMSDSDPAGTFGFAARRLDGFALAYLHVVEPLGDGPVPHLRVTPLIREVFRGPLIVNGGYDAASAQRAVSSGQADLVSFGVPFLANPDLPRRLAEGAPLNEADPSTFYGGDECGYTDYPALQDSQR